MSTGTSLTFALAGNPNSGKTTLFNYLTGSTAHVGNWPGVTVDIREGLYAGPTETVGIVDLPGIYSMSPYTPEETVSRGYILKGELDLVINVVDSTNLERNLYLTTQILESDIPVVIALNMSDIIAREGVEIDVSLLRDRLGVPVVAISALDAKGVRDLMETACETALKTRRGESPLERSYMSQQFDCVIKLYRENEITNPVFRAAKAVEGEALTAGRYPALVQEASKIRKGIALPEMFTGDFEAAVADVRYKYIENICRGVVRRHNLADASASDRIDAVITSKLFGLPIFFAVMFIVFHLTFSENLILSKFLVKEGIKSPGVFLQGLTVSGTDWIKGSLGGLLSASNAPQWLCGLIVNGLLSGVGSVLSFIPQILMLFLFLSLMEDSGYMARAAMLMDRPLRRFGLSGRAFLPMLMGFGCSVPAIMGTRTLASDAERRLVVMLMPFFSCGAKLPIWSLFAAAIFPGHADLTVFGMYIIGIVAAVMSAIILRRTLFKEDASFLIMELPAYRMPRVRNVAMNLWEKTRDFITRAVTVIAVATMAIWFLSNFNFALKMVEPNSEGSIVGSVSSFPVPFFRPLGFASSPDAWKTVVAIVTGLVAKEMVVSTLGVLYNPEVGGTSHALSLSLASSFSPAAALSFMTFNLLCIPCIASVAAAKIELRRPGRIAGAVSFWIAMAWVGSFIVYRAVLLI